jgi:hypothetical protein
MKIAYVALQPSHILEHPTYFASITGGSLLGTFSLFPHGGWYRTSARLLESTLLEGIVETSFLHLVNSSSLPLSAPD